MDEQRQISVRIVDESGSPWGVDVGARYLLDLRAVMHTGFRVGWDEGAERSGQGVLVQRIDPSSAATSVLPFAALPREPDRVVPWESNLVYAPDDPPAVQDVVVPTSATLFGGPDRTVRGADNELVQVDLITFHNGSGEPIRLPDNVRRSYAEQMRTVNGYRNGAEAAEAVEQHGVDRTIEENLLEGVETACVTLHVVAPFLADSGEPADRSVAVPGPPTGGEAILRIVLTYDLAAVRDHLSAYYRELEQDAPDPDSLEELDNSLTELIWERFLWADSSEEAIEDVLHSTSPLATT